MWALLFIRSSAGAHRHSRVRTSYGSYVTHCASGFLLCVPRAARQYPCNCVGLQLRSVPESLSP